MKSFAFLFLSVFLSSSFLLANQLDSDRSILQRMTGDNAYLPATQSIDLGEEINGLNPGEKISALTLNTPHAGKSLQLQGKRSIVLLEESDLNQVDESLKMAIQEVVNNKSEALKEIGIEYSKPGVENFYVLANYEASQSAGAPSEWFVAVIPHDVVVEEVILQTEWFGTGAGGHNQVRLILDTPVVAIPQSAHTHTPFVFDYNGKGDLTYALQAARIQGAEQDWAPLKGVMGEFSNALQLFDTRTLALDQISRSVIDGLTVLKIDENMTAAEKREVGKKTKAVLVKAIVDSDSEQELSIYNTVFASCVTYALKALKAGIPEIKTTWFNPYSIERNVVQAMGISTNKVLNSMNDQYGPLLRSLGGKVMTRKEIAKTKAANAVRSLREPVLMRTEFDEIVQKITVFIIQEGITYNQVQIFIEEAQKPDVDFDKIAKTDAGKQLLTQIRQHWEQSFEGRDLADFFKALKGIQTQQSAEAI